MRWQTHPMSVAKPSHGQLCRSDGLTKHPKWVGIGETGLAYQLHADRPKRSNQPAPHIAASRDSGLP